MNLNHVLETLLYTVSTNMHEIFQVLTSCCFPNGSNSKVNVSFIYSSYHFYFDIFRLNSSHCLFNRMGYDFFPLSKSSPIDELSHFHAFILPFICVCLYLYISMMKQCNYHFHLGKWAESCFSLHSPSFRCFIPHERYSY